MTFPEIDTQLRTDVSFDEMSDEDHHLGPSHFHPLVLGWLANLYRILARCISSVSVLSGN
jgi:hypothetical protein